MRKLLAAAILGSTSLIATAALADGTPTLAAGSADHGHSLLMQKGCYECHGTVGQGGSAAPRIAPDPLPAENILAYVRHPAGQMPPYSPKVLSDQDVADIRAYLASIPKPPPLSQLPLLSSN